MLMFQHISMSVILWDWLCIKMTKWWLNNKICFRGVICLFIGELSLILKMMWTAEIQFKWRYYCRSGNCNLSNCKLIKKKLVTSTGFRSHGLCVSAALLYWLSYKEPYIAPSVWWVCCLSLSFCCAACTSMSNCWKGLFSFFLPFIFLMTLAL